MDSKAATAYKLVADLNLKIRGWANYHRHVVSKQTFVRVDTHIYKALWQWARRRHHKKNRHWVAEKYFGRTDLRNWRLFGEARNKSGKKMRNWLCFAASTPIKRHTKIKGDCNPYDPAWEVYLEERLGVKMDSTLRGRRRLSFLWREQKGICPVCDGLITKLTGWHNHHIVWRVMGGSDSSENRVLIRESRAHPPKLSQASSCERFIRNETASFIGRLTGTSRVRRKSQARFCEQGRERSRPLTRRNCHPSHSGRARRSACCGADKLSGRGESGRAW